MKLLQKIMVISLVALWALAGHAREQEEHVATLYANDGQTLYTVEPNTGDLTKIGDYDLPAPFYVWSITFDWHEHRLFAFAYIDAQKTADNPSGQVLVSINPKNAHVKNLGMIPLPQLPGLSPPLGSLAYDPATRTLCGASWPSYLFCHIYAIDPETLAVTDLTGNTFTAEPDGDLIFFAPHGRLWILRINENDMYLQERSFPDGRFLGISLDLSVPYLNYADGIRGGYAGLSFDPYTNVLFGTYVPSSPTRESGPLQLCTVDLTTGKPEKVIASYKMGFEIAWAP